MRTVDIQELKSTADELSTNVINNDEFFEVETNYGRAVVINEREWDVFINSLGVHSGKRK